MLDLIEHVPVFLVNPPSTGVDSDLFENSAKWILDQASWVILAALVILGLRAWMNGSLMTLFGGIVVAGILFLFTTGENGSGGHTLLDNLAGAVQKIFAGNG
jgi:hypothetical protein